MLLLHNIIPLCFIDALCCNSKVNTAELRSQPTPPRSKVMERKPANVLHHECYSIEKEANKRHSGRLINQDQSGRIEASYITSTRMSV